MTKIVQDPKRAVLRSDTTGRFLQVETSKGIVKPSAVSEAVVKQTSNKRRAALQRLANR